MDNECKNVLSEIDKIIKENKFRKMKIPYQIRIEQETLDKLKALKEKIISEGGETSVNAEIRQAIKKHLKE